ncbi:LLM class flavin-dependent oxidoreductase [Paenarthrobacter sp. NPDC056912]|uniref:LLM class flavin-dependent oxidoreductase n=1 Tax=Paenarthrobacter sp. NPDC056912 TaxID=3345965 RepID=UPI00366C6CFC
MILGTLLSPTSSHVAGWRHPEAVSNASVTFNQMLDYANQAENAKFDFVFLADELSAPEADREILSRDPVVYRFEPLTLAAALAGATREIGIVVTQTTTYNEPYHIARKLASIDNLSDGRAGWNLVTSYVTAEASNFSRKNHLSNVDRYARAEEFYKVVRGLWDSWGDDAFVLDKASGRYFEPSDLHLLNHEGDNFQVRGPLNVVRPVQGRPVQIQAGSSEGGLNLAAKYAEVAFTAQRTIEDAKAFSADLRSRTVRAGRSADSVKVLAGAIPVVAETEQAARKKWAELQSLIHPEIGLARLSQLLGFDVTRLPLDAPLPEEIPATQAYQSRQQLIVQMARRENLTLRELYPKVVGSYGHPVFVGTATTIADTFQEWFENGAVDGFLIVPTFLPVGLHDFNRLVMPELKRRGLFRNEYSGTTLRDHLGLARPAHGEGYES